MPYRPSPTGTLAGCVAEHDDHAAADARRHVERHHDGWHDRDG